MNNQSNDKSIPLYKCPKHGEIANQVLTIGIFDDVRNYKEASFCGLCHFDMLNGCCYQAEKIDEIVKHEKKRILTRN